MLCQFYFQPETVDEALAILERFDGDARILAGGTDLVSDLKTGRKSTEALVDISRIRSFTEIRSVQQEISIGPLVTHAQAAASNLIQKHAPVLSEACSAVGSLQIRNMGTLVGNVVNAMPAADGSSALIALGAGVTIVSLTKGNYRLPVEQLYIGPGQSAIDSTREIVTEIELSLPQDRTGTSFQRLSRRKALSLPVLNAAILLRLDKEFMVFEEARIVVGPVSPLPFRSQEAEKILLSSRVSEKVIDQAGTAAMQEASPRTSVRAGSEYRKEMVKVLVERGIRQALIRIDPEFGKSLGATAQEGT